MELARCAGLRLSEDLMEELCEAYPPFEDMVRRLPRGGALFDEPALVFAPRPAARSREDDG